LNIAIADAESLYSLGVDEKRPLRRHTDDHHFWSLIVLAVTAAAFLLVVWVATKALWVPIASGQKTTLVLREIGKE
jgi:hypothetical protein